MLTVTVLIGNTDNKLTQQRWSDFCYNLYDLIARYSDNIYFNGSPDSTAMFQNYCVVFSAEIGGQFDDLTRQLYELKKFYDQKRIAIVIGETEFI